MQENGATRELRLSRAKQKPDLAAILRKSWFRLRLSVRHPSRVPTWDAIVLTAASPEQAQLYEWQLRRAKRMGRIATSTVTLAVPDPDGQRIGSGAATLNAILALSKHYHDSGVDLGQEVAAANNSSSGSSVAHERSKLNNEVPLLSMINFMAKKHILLLHAGGDSKRVPWGRARSRSLYLCLRLRNLTKLSSAASSAAEMAAEVQGEVCATRSVQVWRSFVDWVAFLFRILVQILRGTPSLAQMLAYVGVRSQLLESSSSSSSSASFKPLPVAEVPLQRSSPEPVAASRGRAGGGGGGVGVGVDGYFLEKLTVVLDLDETLVCAYESSSLPDSICTQATEAGLTWFDLECVSSEKQIEGKPKISYVTVFERPGLHEFLRRTSEFADLVLFTAGLEGYARPLVDRIDQKKRFGLRLYRPSTVSTEYRDHVKDLSCLSKDMSRVVLVDNNPFSFLLQPMNGIPCIPFSAGQPQDNQLLEVLLPLLKQLSQKDDVRPVLYERFHMPEWFRIHGIPSTFPEK